MELSPATDGEGPSRPTRRDSGRVRKKPDAFAASSSPSGAKRKRSQRDAEDAQENKEDQEESESESQDSESDAGEEVLEVKRTARKRKSPQAGPAKKRAKTNQASTPLAIRPRPSRGKRATKARPVKDGITEGADGLYAEVFAQDNTFDAVADNWVKRFKGHEALALADMVNFVLKCAGCDIKVDEHDVEDPDSCTSKLTDIQDEYQATDIVDYPLIAKKTASRLKQSVFGFFQALITRTANEGLLYDKIELMENIEVWVSTMSSAANRPFRHTATMVSLSIISALCDLAKNLVQSASNSLQQRDNEAKKTKVNRARVEALKRRAAQEGKKRELLDSYISDWFDAVFVHRYRDVDPRVRMDCVQALSSWIMTYPDLFFDGNHLRYLGWVLSDMAAPTRLEVIKQLLKLYRDKNKLAGLRTFTERFRPRMVEIATRDAESNVRAAAVELLDLLREAGLLEPDDIDTVGKLVFDSEPRVRQAVAGFFAETINELYANKIEELRGEEALNEDLFPVEGDDDYDSPRLEWLKLKCLLEVLQAYDAEDEGLPSQIERGSGGSALTLLAVGLESRFSLAAQAIYDKVTVLKHWEVLAGYLLFDHSQGTEDARPGDSAASLKYECKLDEKQEVILLEVLNAAVKLQLTQGVEALKIPRKTKAQKMEMAEKQETSARHLSQFIPLLLNKFAAAPEPASAVLRLEHVLNLEIFQELRQDSTNFSALLDNIKNQFLTHGHQSVLDEASAALLHARSYEELEEITEGKVHILWEDTLSHFRTLTKGRDLGTRGNLNIVIVTGLSNTLLRIANLAKISSCIEYFETTTSTKQPQSVATLLIDIIRRGVSASNTEPDMDSLEDLLATSASRSVLFYTMWKVKSWSERISSGAGIADDELDAIAETRDSFVAALTAVMRSRHGADELRSVLAGIYLDVCVLFTTLRQAAQQQRPMRSNSEETATDDYLALILPVPAEMQKVLRRVFAATEKAFAKASNRTLDPAVVDDDESADEAAETQDPESDDEEDDDDEQSERKALEKQRAALLMEQRLCELASKIVLGIIAGVLDGEENPNLVNGARQGDRKEQRGQMRQMLERNKGKLGPNYKAVLDHLDAAKAAKKMKGRAKPKSKTKPEAQVNGRSKDRARAAKKSAEVVEQEDGDEDDDEGVVEEGTEEDLRRRELDDGHEAEVELEVHEEMEANGVEGEEESVLGD